MCLSLLRYFLSREEIEKSRKRNGKIIDVFLLFHFKGERRKEPFLFLFLNHTAVCSVPSFPTTSIQYVSRHLLPPTTFVHTHRTYPIMSTTSQFLRMIKRSTRKIVCIGKNYEAHINELAHLQPSVWDTKRVRRWISLASFTSARPRALPPV